jgi:hypothetical protein
MMIRILKPKSSRGRAHERRELLRRQGLRPIRIWVPDVRFPVVRREAHRQSAVIAASAYARDDQAFINAVTDE